MFELLKKLFPINRSLTGDGVRKTLSIIKEKIDSIKVKEIPSGTKVFDWVIPKEWNCDEAYIVTPDGEVICNYQENNLSLVGYSIPVDLKINLKDLQKHLYSVPKLPNAIPYVTSYYEPNWGFCISHEERARLKEGQYRVIIRSRLETGSLTYGEVYIPSTEGFEKEIFLSTYICHPSMANNELSGPVVTTYLVKWLSSLGKRKYNYRIIFIPETIGSIAYLSQNLDVMKKNIIAGFNVTCVGDNNNYSFLPSRNGKTLADRIAKHILEKNVGYYKEYTFLNRGSDERQYCSPSIDLPVTTICRSKYHEYPEYHTSLDNLDFVSQEGLKGSYDILKKCIESLENNEIYKTNVFCEPQMGKYGLYSNLSTHKSGNWATKDIMNVLAYIDGQMDCLSIAEKVDISITECIDICNILNTNKLITKI